VLPDEQKLNRVGSEMQAFSNAFLEEIFGYNSLWGKDLGSISVGVLFASTFL
jgi:hypothetical protein